MREGGGKRGQEGEKEREREEEKKRRREMRKGGVRWAAWAPSHGFSILDSIFKAY